jgi:sulfur carrier protein
MTTLVNGEPRELEPGTTVAALVEALGMPPRGVAVALDGEIVSRSDWDERPVPDGARVEVVTAMQGGAC